MSWTQFFMYLGIVYLVYYVLMIIIDLIKGRVVATAGAGESEDVLTFSENVEPIAVEDEEAPTIGNPADKDDEVPGEMAEQLRLENEQGFSPLEGTLPQPEDQVAYSGGTTMQGLLKLAREGAIEFTRNVAY